MNYKQRPPRRIYLLFEKRSLLGCFKQRAAANRLRAARMKAGKTGMRVIPYVLEH